MEFMVYNEGGGVQFTSNHALNRNSMNVKDQKMINIEKANVIWGGYMVTNHAVFEELQSKSRGRFYNVTQYSL